MQIMTADNIKKHISYLTADEVTEACQPLFKAFNLNYFAYGRVYPDNSIVILSSDRKWNHHFIERNYHKKTSITYSSGIHLGPSFVPDEILRNLATNFNHHFWINMAHQYKDYVEFFDFASPPENHAVIELFFNHINLLNNFLLYFKDKTFFLIEQATKERFLFIKPPIVDAPSKEGNYGNFSTLMQTNNIRLHFKSKEIILTRREYEVILQLAQGKTAKEAANTLNLSHRTVEHRLESAKGKSDCSSKAQLIKVLRKNLILPDIINID